jgi:hypothetical protein
MHCGVAGASEAPELSASIGATVGVRGACMTWLVIDVDRS